MRQVSHYAMIRLLDVIGGEGVKDQVAIPQKYFLTFG